MKPSDWNPGKLLETSSYYWKTCTLHTAVKLNLFTLISEGKITAHALAKAVTGSENAVTRLLDALVALALLKKNGLLSIVHHDYCGPTDSGIISAKKSTSA